ncbi:MAG: 2-C-methyl-D-erythritol 4-phosphate cytidylyltransferase [Lachnospiraceae bacterium]|nr:2-C-methyl-D-erythritol 4-phosphate cytidylyltransferase [Lachnospiraceae bacterium]MBP5745608.1 2-C-methyl-D-erythritol 4-phosphate cytidylyltransferase [Lachnospiraceae bacterium]
MKTVAIVLAAGSGSRMNADVKKQFLELAGKPILYYSLNAFQNSFIDEIILVTSKEDIEFCKNEIVKKYDFNKVRCIVEGGRERYHSVMHGLKMIQSCDYVYVHDAARPLVDEEMLERLKAGVEEFGSAVAAVETKDTIKIVDNENYVISTPSRNTVWIIQTPQVFRFTTITEAYERLRMRLQNISAEDIHITDDAMVVENFTNSKVKLIRGSYKNIKITTPEDMLVAERFLQ